MDNLRRPNHGLAAVLHFVRRISCFNGKGDSDSDLELDSAVSDLNIAEMEIAANECGNRLLMCSSTEE
jgi:hypothetical protein